VTLVEEARHEAIDALSGTSFSQCIAQPIATLPEGA